MKKCKMNTALAGYAQAEYSPENWTILMNAKTTGDMNIDNATSVEDVLTALNNAEAAMAAVNTLLDDAKAAAHASLDATLTAYAQADYSPDNWAILINAKKIGNANNAASIAEVTMVLINAQAAMAAVNTLLVDAKIAAQNSLNTALAGYKQDDYSPDNWTALTGFKTAGDTAIDAAADLTGVEAAQSEATTGMDGVQTIAQTLAAEKVAANEVLTTALRTYTESNYTVDNWAALTGFKTAGDTAIDAATDLAGVESAQLAATTGMDGVQTIAQTLAAAKTAANEVLTTALETYTESNYTADNWTALTGFMKAGDTAIDAAADLAGVEAAQLAATTGMDGVQTIAQTLAAAKKAAHDALTAALGIHTECNNTVDNLTGLTGLEVTGDTAIEADAEVEAIGDTAIDTAAEIDPVEVIDDTAIEATAEIEVTDDTAIESAEEIDQVEVTDDTAIDAAAEIEVTDDTAIESAVEVVLTEDTAIESAAEIDQVEVACDTAIEAAAEIEVTDDTAIDATAEVEVTDDTVAAEIEVTDNTAVDTAAEIEPASQKVLVTIESTLNEAEVKIEDLESTHA